MDKKNIFFAGILALSVSLFSASTANAERVTEASVAEWLAAYGEAWETRDADAAAALFTGHATYQENPHEEPFTGPTEIRDYWSKVTADQRDVSFTADVITTFDRSGVAHWSATFGSASSGATISLDGVFLLEFDESGLCSALREWWIVKVDPPPSAEQGIRRRSKDLRSAASGGRRLSSITENPAYTPAPPTRHAR